MKVYDCFSFYNELDLLEIRLNELSDVVDYFVIAEAAMSHSGNPKDFTLLNNWDRFKPWHHKIRRIEVEKFPETSVSWVREKFQRDSLAQGLTDLEKDDLVIISDLDEIPRAEIIDAIKTDENRYERYILQIPLFRYRFNFLKYHTPVINNQIIITRAHVFTNPERERDYTHLWLTQPNDVVYIEHAGWHFSYLGDDKNAINKLQNFAHTEQNIPEIIRPFSISRMLKEKVGPDPKNQEKFENIVLDNYFPKYILDNKEKYRDLIISDAKYTINDFWPIGN